MDEDDQQQMRDHVALCDALQAGRLDQLPEPIVTDPAYPNVSDPYTGTPLIIQAIASAPQACVRELVENGADVNVAVDDGFPAVLGAVLSRRPDRLALVETLVSLGADIERRGINNWTPLHAAASSNDADMVKLLLRLGADPTARTVIDDDATPLEEARRAKASDAAAVLEAVDGT